MGVNSKTTEIKDVFLLLLFSGTIITTSLGGEHVVEIVCSLDPTFLLFTPTELARLSSCGLQGLQGNAMLPTLPTLPPRASGDISGLFNPALFLSAQLSPGQRSADFAFCTGLQECLGLAMYITFSKKWGVWQAIHIITLQNRLENSS